MENIIRLSSVDLNLNAKLRTNLTYLSILLFIGFAGFVTISVKNYVSDTLSITFVEPEITTSNFDAPFSEETSVDVIIRNGDTLKTILKAQELPKNDILQIIKIAEEQQITSSLKIGQQITFDYDLKILENDSEDLASETRTLNRMTLSINKLNSLEIIREDNNFIARTTTVPLNRFVAKSSVVIETNFMAALRSLGLSTNSIVELINSYSYQVDFQRQIQPGDTISVVTEKFATEDGKFSHHGKILHASLILSGKEYNIYRYSPENVANNHGFFSEDGKSVKRSLLRTPVKVVRVSSHFGVREKHPVHGYSKMHKGVDFAAPIGTPINAAGDGVITEIGWKSGYGKIIQVKHSPTLTTVYAHASKFAKNLKLGSYVKQGDVIAYVGMTGHTTGPHLHYEVKIDGKHVNPMSIKTTPGIQLAGAQLLKFQQFKNHLKTLDDKFKQGIEVAENDLLF
jgi:murein DD-endopeptidase MepM/ murein hydrolase activator NlpD